MLHIDMTKIERLTKLRIKTMDLQSQIGRQHHALIKAGELGDRKSGENEAFREAMNLAQALLNALQKIG